MTEMRRITFSVPNELDEAVINLKKQDEFVRDSYSEVIRKLLVLGLEIVNQQKTAG